MKWEYQTQEFQTVLGAGGYGWVQEYENYEEIRAADDRANVEALDRGDHTLQSSKLARTLDEVLNDLGADGWELIAFTPEVPDTKTGLLHHTRAVFKRPGE